MTVGLCICSQQLLGDTSLMTTGYSINIFLFSFIASCVWIIGGPLQWTTTTQLIECKEVELVPMWRFHIWSSSLFGVSKYSTAYRKKKNGHQPRHKSFCPVCRMFWGKGSTEVVGVASNTWLNLRPMSPEKGRPCPALIGSPICNHFIVIETKNFGLAIPCCILFTWFNMNFFRDDILGFNNLLVCPLLWKTVALSRWPWFTCNSL